MHPIQTAPAFESPLHPPSAFIAFVTSVVTAIPTNQLALQLHPPPPPFQKHPSLSLSLSLLALHHLGMGWHEKTQAQNPTRPWDQQLLLDLPHKQREEGEENARYPPPAPTKKYHPKTCSPVSKCTLTSKLAPSLSLSLFFVLVHVKSPNSTDTETH